MSCTKFRFLHPRSRSQSGQRSNSCLGNNSKNTEANLTKLRRKIEHHGKECCVQELGSYVKGQGHNQVRYVIIKIKVLCPRSGSHRKVKQNDNFCPVQDSGFLAVFKVTARDQSQYKGPFADICYIL